MDRYDTIQILKSTVGQRYYKTVKYPDIPVRSDDVYFLSTKGDRFDLVATDYYDDPSLYWIIAEANSFPKDSFYIPEGKEVRVPTVINGILIDFENINIIR